MQSMTSDSDKPATGEYQYWIKLDNDDQYEYFIRWDLDENSIEIWYQDEWRQTWSTNVEFGGGFVGTFGVVAVVDVDRFMEDETRWGQIVDEDVDSAIAQLTVELNPSESDEEWPPAALS